MTSYQIAKLGEYFVIMKFYLLMPYAMIDWSVTIRKTNKKRFLDAKNIHISHFITAQEILLSVCCN